MKMKFPVLCIPFLPVAGIALFPFILLKKQSFKGHAGILNHERIHLAQQIELMLLGFYVLYLLHYLYNLLKYRNHDKAYHNIVFEKEAYAKQDAKNYLSERRLWHWVRYL